MDLGKFHKLLKSLENRRNEIRDSLVLKPASTLEEYRERVGRWIELDDTLKGFSKILRGDEED